MKLEATVTDYWRGDLAEDAPLDDDGLGGAFGKVAVTSETWKHLYDAQKWAELDLWWRFSEDKAALTELFNWLVENIPKTTIENGTESVRQPISSREATCEWTHAASVLEQGELESTNLGDPQQALLNGKMHGQTR
jgi:hypothetical protein